MYEAPNLLDIFDTNLLTSDISIVEFAESDQFCNRPLYPRQRVLLKIIFLEELDGYEEDVLSEWIKSSKEGGEVQIAPMIRERMDYLREQGYKHFRQNQLVGGRRSSKGFVTALALTKKLYELTRIGNVRQHFGIPQGKEIYFSIVADSLDQAKAYQFADASNTILECKPLLDQKLLSKALAESVSVFTPYDKMRARMLLESGMRVDKDLASLIVKAFGTNAKTIRGQATIAFVFDEMAHLIAGESRMSDEQLYQAVSPALQQFGEHALIFFNSSPYTKTGKFYEIYEWAQTLLLPDGTSKVVERNEVDLYSKDATPAYPDLFMMRFPSWELYKDWERERGKFAKAIMVDPKFDSILAQEERADPESFAVEYRSHFAEVVNAYLRPEVVDRMFSPENQIAVLGETLQPTAGAVAFTTYAGHGDPASTGANFGLAIGHVVTIKNPETGVEEAHVVFDFVNAFRPEDFEEQEHTIDVIGVVLPTIEDLINNFRPERFSFDQFDSIAPMQILNRDLAARGIQDTRVEMERFTGPRNETRAKNFKAAANLNRVHIPNPVTYGSIDGEFNPLWLGREELKRLTEKNGKVEKQNIGAIRTKDIADCIMVVTDYLIGEKLAAENALLKQRGELGAQGGFGQAQAAGRVYGSEGSIFEEWYDRHKTQYPPHMPQRGRGYWGRR